MLAPATANIYRTTANYTKEVEILEFADITNFELFYVILGCTTETNHLLETWRSRYLAVARYTHNNTERDFASVK
jgi:hypothetical protein